MKQNIGKTLQKKLREIYHLGNITANVLRKEGFATKEEYWRSVYEHHLITTKITKEDQKQKDKEERKQKRQDLKRFNKLKKPQYNQSIEDNTHKKIYTFKNVNTEYGYIKSPDLYEFILDNMSNMKKAIEESGGKYGIKACMKAQLVLVNISKVESLLNEKQKGNFNSGNFNAKVISAINAVKKDVYFNSNKLELLYATSNITQFITSQAKQIQKKIEDHNDNGSDIVVVKIKAVYLEIIKNVNPTSASSYMELPKWVHDKKACVNMKNEDNKCSKWAFKCLKYQAQVKHHKERISKYKDFKDETDYSSLSYPTNIHGWDKFEEDNNVKITILGINKENFYILRNPIYRDNRPVYRLLLIGNTNEDKNHYVPILDMGRLLTSEKTKHHSKHYFCDNCHQHFTTETKLAEHCIFCESNSPCKSVYPTNENKTVSFGKVKNTQFCPYMIVADCEAITNKVHSCINKDYRKYKGKYYAYTKELQRHECSGMYYTVIDSVNKEETKSEMFDNVNDFIISLNNEADRLHELVKMNIEMKDLSDIEKEEFEKCTECHICKKKILNEAKKVRDHDHLTGKYRGAAHNSCNLNFNLQHFRTPVFLHNFAGYDQNIIMNELSNKQRYKLTPIAMNSEKFMSLGVNNFDFRDSMKHLNEGLDKLASGLSEEDFKLTNTHFGDKAYLMRQKGVYPYDYVDNFNRLKETSLPPKEEFFSKLKHEHITDEQYEHAQLVWKEFKCDTLQDYHDIYLKSDVYILADVFMKYRLTSFKDFGIDPAWYISLPQFSWDCAMKYTDVKLELLTDPDMYLFVEKGIRGGISVIRKRHAKANNPYMKDYDDTKPTTYIAYQDANNLYGWAMSQALPLSNFKWDLAIDDYTEKKIMNMDFENGKTGYIFMVDLEYPKEIHDLHNDYPLAVERMSVDKDMLSSYQLKIGEDLSKKGLAVMNTKTEKLIGNLKNKTDYVIHGRNLQQCLELGLKITKVSKVLKFKQEAWLKPYIDFNTNKRAQTTNKFEQDFYKLMNNAIFGKTMENVRNRINYKLSYGDEKLVHKYKSRFNLMGITEFNNNLVGIQLEKLSVKLNKPITVGFTILELSKTLMYDYYYNNIIVKYGRENVNLLFTDTDSLCMEIKTKDIYDDYNEDCETYDMSDYPLDHKCHNKTNKKVIGKFKDETKGKIIDEFVGLKAKMYSMSVVGDKDKKIAKGCKKPVIEKGFNFDLYKSVLLGEAEEGYYTRNAMIGIRSKQHQLSTLEVGKVGLCAYDDKSYILEDGINTLAYGHYKIPQLNL